MAEAGGNGGGGGTDRVREPGKFGEDGKIWFEEAVEKMKKWLAAAGVALILAGTGWGLLGAREIRWLNPLSPNMAEIEEKTEIIGFMPTWMVGKTREYTKEIDQMVFLGVGVSEDGSLIWEPQARKIFSEAYVDQKNLIKKNGGKNIVGIKQFEDERIEELLASSEARARLIEELRELVEREKFDGVNVDFEFMDDPYRVLSAEFGGLMEELKKAGLGEISVDVFANTIIKGDPEKIKNLNNTVDRIIVMAYDFKRPGAQFAGAVAPLTAPPGIRNISEIVEKVETEGIDKKKMVLAYPLYGYEFKTENRDYGSATSSSWGQMVSVATAKKMVEKAGEREDMVILWDEITQTPYMSFVENETRYKTVWLSKYRKKTVAETVMQIHQVYYEDLKSIGLKVDLAKDKGFGGIGFWALGYEGEDGEVWEMVKNDL